MVTVFDKARKRIRKQRMLLTLADPVYIDGFLRGYYIAWRTAYPDVSRETAKLAARDAYNSWYKEIKK